MVVLDPLSALSVAGAVVQFAGFIKSFFETGIEIFNSAEGTPRANVELEAITLRSKELLRQLSPLHETLPYDGDDKLAASEGNVRKLAFLCEDVATELLGVLENLKAQGQPNQWKSFLHAIQCLWTQKKVDEFSNRLSKYRDEMSFHLLVFLSGNQSKLEKALHLLDDRISSTVEYLSQESRNTRRDIVFAVYNSNLHSERPSDIAQTSGMLSQMAEQERHFLEQKFLSSLAFERMPERRQRIAKASDGTFEWVFRRDGDSTSAGKELGSWLKSQNGLFWISGKAGSGKSTFMKHLETHNKTYNALSAWAGSDPLVHAGFYFWNSGESMQKSQLGLLRGLMYEVVKHAPSLIPTIFPLRWQSSLHLGSNLPPWTEPELIEGFECLQSDNQITTKFCFFIDGLDEYDGDHRKLADCLKLMCSVPSIKICASSRPWTVFEDAFSNCCRLSLQELTRPDIEAYIHNGFDQNVYYKMLTQAEPKRMRSLVSEIAKRAEGVFLWVYLVMRSLKEGLGAGDRIADLERRIKAFPTELEDYFAHMLVGLQPKELEEATQLFRLVLEAECPLTLWTLSYYDEEDPNFALHTKLEPLSVKELSARAERMRRRLNSRCKGLLEAHRKTSKTRGKLGKLRPSRHASEWDFANMEVEFLHRSVRDFLTTPTQSRHLVAQNSESFNPHLTLLRAYVAQIKGYRAPNRKDRRKTHLWKLIEAALAHARKLEQTTNFPLGEILVELDHAASERYSDITCTSGHHLHWSDCRLIDGFYPLGTSFLHFACENGLVQYVAAKLQHPDTNSDPQFRASLLMSALGIHVGRGPSDPPLCFRTDGKLHLPYPDMVPTLLSNGIHPNQEYRGHTAWGSLVSTLYRAYYQTPGSNVTASKDERAEELAAWADVIKLLIAYGANGNLVKLTCETPFSARYTTIDLQRDQGYIPLPPSTIFKAIFPEGVAADLLCSLQRNLPGINRQRSRHSTGGQPDLDTMSPSGPNDDCSRLAHSQTTRSNKKPKSERRGMNIPLPWRRHSAA